VREGSGGASLGAAARGGGESLRLGARVPSVERQQLACAKPVRIADRQLEHPRRRTPARPAHMHRAIRPAHRHPRDIADRIRQRPSLRIADFIEHPLRRSGAQTGAPGPRRNREGA
jgi:hypothetical protein